ncbi:acyl-CoA dehydrogenase/oxidase, partial [Thraustotheca clavata]
MNTSELEFALAEGKFQVIEQRKRWIEEIEYPLRVYGRSHREEYVATLERSKILVDFFKKHGIHDVDDQEAISEALGIVLPLDMHRKMFAPALQLSMSQEQWLKWKDIASSYRILGAYAQTELGHGSNIRAIETIAMYDKERQSIDLHSPTLTSRKWWPGGLGKTANFAVVYARLVADNIDYGLHAFLVQLRDLKTHETLPGIELGDIGAKIGFNGVDNGFCTFNHVALPKESLLMGSAR